VSARELCSVCRGGKKARGPRQLRVGLTARTQGDSKRRAVPKLEGRADAAKADSAWALGGESGTPYEFVRERHT
jgi:hypothetical protein